MCRAYLKESLSDDVIWDVISKTKHLPREINKLDSDVQYFLKIFL